MGKERRLRTIREQPLFEKCKSEIGHSSRRLDERFDAVVWAASSSDVSDFPLIPGTDIRVARLDAGGDLPAIRLYFRLEGQDYVDFEFLEVVPDEEQKS